jgi:nicotinamide N-methyltransferase
MAANHSKVLVSFTHHRPHKMDKDLHFFKIAQEEPFHFRVTKHFSKMMTPMFEQDDGPEDIRSTVHFYTLDWNK